MVSPGRFCTHRLGCFNYPASKIPGIHRLACQVAASPLNQRQNTQHPELIETPIAGRITSRLRNYPLCTSPRRPSRHHIIVAAPCCALSTWPTSMRLVIWCQRTRRLHAMKHRSPAPKVRADDDNVDSSEADSAIALVDRDVKLLQVIEALKDHIQHEDVAWRAKCTCRD